MLRISRPLLHALPFVAAAATGATMLWLPATRAQDHVWTTKELFQRNIGTKEDQTKAFPPHKIIGNLYYVGTTSLGSFLVVTPAGNILIDSTYEVNVPGIQKSVEQLGFKFSDTKILLGSHAHGDHQEGDAMVKELTGAQVMAMAEDVPALQNMKPGGKPHPIDRILHDGDTVTLGGMTLVAHLTPGHTHGDTTWSMKVQEAGKSYDVVIIGSMGFNGTAQQLLSNPALIAEYEQGFRVSRSLACDVPLGSHPAMYDLVGKYAKLVKNPGGPNPFIDPQGYKTEIAIEEGAYRALLSEKPAEKPAAPATKN
jgi:metallo-beta-lactamase class B